MTITPPLGRGFTIEVTIGLNPDRLGIFCFEYEIQEGLGRWGEGPIFQVHDIYIEEKGAVAQDSGLQ
jgi:hypothetical protein